MKKFIIFVGIACSVGVMYALSTLRGIPDAFDWEDDDE
jgi:hypothetical protein